MNRYCEAMVRKEGTFICANRETYPGLRITCDPITKVPPDADPQTLGNAVLETLAAYRAGTPHPSREELKAPDPALRGTGFKTWTAMRKGSTVLGIKATPDIVEVSPTETDGKGNFSDLTSEAVRAAPDPAAVGQAMIEALSRCRTGARF